MRISDWSSDVCSSDLPEDYVPDLNLRMALYRRLNDLESSQQIESFAAEMIDRFGPLPDATKNLLTLIAAKLDCRTARVGRLEVGPRGAVVSFHNATVPNPAALIRSEEHTSELPPLMRTSYAVFCLKTNKNK